MSNAISNIISRTLNLLHREDDSQALDSDTREFYLEIVEMVVDGTDTNIRLVPGYKNKLLTTVGTALKYVDQLVDQFPSPIRIDSKVFASSPYANAFFATPNDLQETIHQSPEIKDYITSSKNYTSESCCALLCMQKKEKSVLGMGLSEGQLRRDVLQKAVSFHDYKIYAAAPTESESRKELKCCLFQGLVTNAFEQIMELREKRRQLEIEQQTLSGRLRSRNADENSELSVLQKKLKDTQSQLKELVLLTPQVALDVVNSVLGCPDDFVKIRKEELQLNKMGIRTQDGSELPINHLELTEVRIHGQVPRIVMLATLDMDDLPSPV